MKRNTILAALVAVCLILPGLSVAAARPALILNINATEGTTNPPVTFAIDSFTTSVVNDKVEYTVGFANPTAQTAVTCRQAKGTVNWPIELNFIYGLINNPLDPMQTDGRFVRYRNTANGPAVLFQAQRVAYCYGDGLAVQGSQPGVRLRVVVDGVDITHALEEGNDRDVVTFDEARRAFVLNTRQGFSCGYNDGQWSGLFLQTGAGAGATGQGGLVPIEGNVTASVEGNKLTINTVGGTPGGFQCAGPGNIAIRLNAVEAPGQDPISTLTAYWSETTFTPAETGGVRGWIGLQPNSWFAFQKSAVPQSFLRFHPQLRQQVQALLPAGTVLPEDLKIEGEIAFVNRADCPTLDVQVLRNPSTNLLNLGQGATSCGNAGQRWQVFLDDVDITSQLNVNKPLSLFGRRVQLNYLQNFAGFICPASDAAVATASQGWNLVLPYGSEATRAWFVYQVGNQARVYTYVYAQARGLVPQ